MIHVHVRYSAALQPTMDKDLDELAKQFQGKTGSASLASGVRMLNFVFEQPSRAASFCDTVRKLDGVTDVETS